MSHQHSESSPVHKGKAELDDDLEALQDEIDTGEDASAGLLNGTKRHEFEIDLEAHRGPQSKRSAWTRGRRSNLLDCCAGVWNASTPTNRSVNAVRSQCSPCRLILKILVATFALIGIFNIVLLTTDYVATLFPDHSGQSTSTNAYNLSRPADLIYHWPTDYTADIRPVACHSHNDYWRPIPVISAVKAGCTGVEADVWLVGDELYVGHSRSSLTAQRTFRALYVEPLLSILEKQNQNTTFHPIFDSPRSGVFDTNNRRTLVLLIDFKTDGHDLWRFVTEQLQPLRSRHYLTHFNGTRIVQGPLTVVVTGNAPFDKVIENFDYRDMFFDAPLQIMGDIPNSEGNPKHRPIVQNIAAERAFLDRHTSNPNTTNSIIGNDKPTLQTSFPTDPSIYTPSNSYYVSTSFFRTIGTPLPFLSSTQLEKIRAQIHGAHYQGLNVRYWDTPAWPVGLRNYIWQMLVREGVDYLNVDDLDTATKGDWQKGMRGTIWSGKGSWHP